MGNVVCRHCSRPLRPNSGALGVWYSHEDGNVACNWTKGRMTQYGTNAMPVSITQEESMTNEGFDFRASAKCNGEQSGCGCLEVATNMVEVNGLVGLRDSKTGTTAVFTTHEWRGFLDGAKAGEFDI